MARPWFLIALAGAGAGMLAAFLWLVVWIWAGRGADWPLRLALERRIERGSASLPAAPAYDERRRVIGFRLYSGLCARCHSEPGGGRETWADSLEPPPTDLTQPGRVRDTRQLFWIICHGEAGTGMPAWRGHRSNDAIWDVALFVQDLPRLGPPDYQQMMATYGPTPEPLGMTPDASCFEKTK
jgi:mono/diheme cytochrome c family protein